MSNYAHNDLARALKAYKRTRKLRKAADRVLRQDPATITLTAANGDTVTLAVPHKGDLRQAVLQAAVEASSEAYAREQAAYTELAHCASEMLLMAQSETPQQAQASEPAAAEATPAAPTATPAPALTPEPSPEAAEGAAPAWAAVFIDALRHGATLAAAARSAGVPYLLAHQHKLENAAFRAEFDAALLAQNQ